MEESLENRKDGHEMPLIELLATIIRHRVLVLWTTAIGTVAAAAILFAFPQLGINLINSRTLTLQVAVRVAVIPQGAQGALNIDVPALVQAQASSLKLMVDTYQATLITAKERALTRPALNRAVRTFVDKSFQILPDRRSDTVLITLKVKEPDQEKGTKFLNQFVTKAQSDLKARGLRQIAQAISDLELSGKDNSELAVQTRTSYQIAAKALQGVAADPDFPLSALGEVDVLQDEPQFSSSLVLLTSFFASALLGVFLAIGAETVLRTQRDPEAMDMLTKAWRSL